MRRLPWKVRLGLGLVALSAALYVVHFAIFRDSKHIFLYLVGDIAFLPMDVLLVTLILHQVLTGQERRAMLRKMNMVIGSFYSEVGTELMRLLAGFDPEVEKLQGELRVTKDWTEGEFARVRARVRGHKVAADCRRGDLDGLRAFLVGRRVFLLGLLQNPNLLEHETFTELLWAVFHLTEELAQRRDVGQLPDTDLAHLAGDIQRAYGLLIGQWLDYMQHLKADYPYLFSLAMRTNPFDPTAAPEVK